MKRAIAAVEKPEAADEVDAFTSYVATQMRTFSQLQNTRFQRDVIALVWRYQDENAAQTTTENMNIEEPQTEYHYLDIEELAVSEDL